jgi:hypothetical protein
MSEGHMPYQLRLLALASAKSVWSQELFLEICSELQVNPDHVKTFQNGSIHELKKIGAA